MWSLIQRAAGTYTNLPSGKKAIQTLVWFQNEKKKKNLDEFAKILGHSDVLKISKNQHRINLHDPLWFI